MTAKSMTAKSMTNHSKIRRLLAVIILADKVRTVDTVWKFTCVRAKVA